MVAEVTDWMFAQTDEAVFKVEHLPGFDYAPVKGSFNRIKCAKCGEYVFERYVRMVGDEPRCIPCSGYGK